MCSFLDRYTLVSNSDAHSPEKLGRNANLFTTDVSYDAIIEAMKTGDPGKFGGTFDMFPQEGKYHYDGHRKCGIRWDPVETLKHQGICPVCGKKVTVGVVNRIVRLSDREDEKQRQNRLPYYSIIPLKEILSEIEGVGEKSKKVTHRYEHLIRKAGNEFNLLQYLPIDEIRQAGGEVLAEAIRRMRGNEVIIHEGFDGEYGQIKVFQPDEIKYLGSQESLFGASRPSGEPARRKRINFDLAEYHQWSTSGEYTARAAEERPSYSQQASGPLKGLNNEQAQAAAHPEGPAAVIAGPGTGKTRVLTRRIAWLIDEKKINPGHILAITFTNKAAGEMRERCRQLTSQDASDANPTIATFHAFGYQLLQSFSAYTHRSQNFSIVDEQDKKDLIAESFNLDRKEASQYAQRFSQWKQKATRETKQEDQAFKHRLEAYNELLAQYNLYDLDDLIYEPVRLLENNPEVRKQMQNRYPWILIDEFQDINPIQYRLIQLLTIDSSPNLFLIGDPNQAIYGFRGSSRAFISRFMEENPQTKVYQLQTSYRCSQNILKASGDVLQEEGLKGLDDGMRIKIAPQQTDRSEAEYIARTIESLSGGLRFFSMDSNLTRGEGDEQIQSLSDLAILCRTKSQMKTIEKALLDHTIPYQLVAEQEFFSHPLVKNTISMLELSRKRDNPFLKHKSTRLTNNHTNLQGHLDALDTIPDMKGKLNYIWDNIQDSSDKEKAEEIRRKLLDAASSYGNQTDEFIRYIKLGSSSDAYEEQTEKVTVMTLHASKGLEFQCVFIAGCEDGLIPHKLYEQQETDREEEKRLLYVGMTRARSYLYLTHARKRFLYGQEKTMQRSPFLNQIERELTEVEENTYQKKKQDDSQLKLF
jgi:superfamily I DNA/RNA helicase